MLNGIVALAFALLLGLQVEPAADRIYGRVLTAGGDRLEGYLRWDRNETHWFDFLDGEKAIPWEHVREAEGLDEDLRRRGERERSISLLGLRISWEEDDGEPRTTSSGVRFGHVRSLEVVDDRRAVLVLESGEEVELLGGSTDIGRSFRGLTVEDVERGAVELRWRDLDRVDFVRPPPGHPAPLAERLHGTLRTRAGVEIVGYVAWDLDETLTTDVLDGESGGRDHDIPFGDIAAIEREGSARARVTLRGGEELILRGTNDVNSDNRGIEISDPSFGRAVVGWREFESLTFHPAVSDGREGPGGQEPVRGRAAFDGGRPLLGTVETRGGEAHRGRIRWDNDEQFTWEILDGRSEGVEYDVELGRVHTIETVGSSSARVTLLDGRALLLEGSNDVNEDNQGIFVRLERGETILVRWTDLQRVTFDP